MLFKGWLKPGYGWFRVVTGSYARQNKLTSNCTIWNRLLFFNL